MSDPPDSSSGEDPFENLVLDDAFVAAASKREAAAEERLRNAARSREAHAAHLDEQREARRLQQRSARRRRSVRGAGAATLIVVIAAFVAWGPPIGEDLVIGGGDRPAEADRAEGDDHGGHIHLTTELDGLADLPSPPSDVSPVPLGAPSDAHAHLDDRGGPYLFVATQVDDGRPVAYDPCRPIRYVVNPRNEPPGGAELVEDAITTISTITGLVFEAEGTTSEEPSDERQPFQPDRYGDRWAPVLVAWSDPESYPRLLPPTVGVGGSAAIALGDGSPMVFVTGTVALDGDELGQVMGTPDGDAFVTGVILHELGHLVGLDHVNDPTQLMHDFVQLDNSQLGDGDIEGLRHLGRGECVPGL